MATIITEVFRFVNLRAPAKKPISTNPIPTIPTDYIQVKPVIQRVTTKPGVVTVEEWNDTLIQKMLMAKNDPLNAGNQRIAMLAEISNHQITSSLPTDNLIFQNKISVNLSALSDWIELNQTILDKNTLSNNVLECLNSIRENETPLTLATLNDYVNSAEFVKINLQWWDILIITTLHSKRPRLAESIIRCLKLFYLITKLSDFENFPTLSEEIFSLYNIPVDLPSDIFPLPAKINELENNTTSVISTKDTTKAQTLLNDARKATHALELVKEILFEEHRQALNEFEYTFDVNGIPTNLASRPSRDLDNLTSLDLENIINNACENSLSEELVEGISILENTFFCENKTKVSFSFIERELNRRIQKNADFLRSLIPQKELKTVMINGTIMTYESIR